MTPSNDLMSVVRLRGVAKTYRVGTVDVEALRGVTLDIHQSRFSVVIGPALTLVGEAHCLQHRHRPLLPL